MKIDIYDMIFMRSAVVALGKKLRGQPGLERIAEPNHFNAVMQFIYFIL
jgi:hypothetical protein